MNFSKALAVPIKLAYAVASADNEVSESEIQVIKKWLQNETQLRTSKEKTMLEKDLERELMELTELDKSGKLNLEQVFHEINKLDDRYLKYSSMDLVIEVMAADNEIHPDEIKLIDKIVDKLDLDRVTAKKYIRKQILKMRGLPKRVDIEGFLKINPTVSNKTAKKIIQQEYKNWISAVTSANTSKHRGNAQKMIDIISNVRERYN
jgi:uncharacterized tellurite resistance protein B-like protein